MASPAQVKFFEKLLGEREFPANVNKPEIAGIFDELDEQSASEWIDKALKLPKVPKDPNAKTVPAPF
jgi:hypothetical protein